MAKSNKEACKAWYHKRKKEIAERKEFIANKHRQIAFEKYNKFWEYLKTDEFNIEYNEATGHHFPYDLFFDRWHDAPWFVAEIIQSHIEGGIERKRIEKIKKENAKERNELMKYARPAWRDHQKINKIYEECKKLNELAGFIKYHVDHIIPIKGREVCGLHWHENLQILTAEENQRKLNKLLY